MSLLIIQLLLANLVIGEQNIINFLNHNGREGSQEHLKIVIKNISLCLSSLTSNIIMVSDSTEDALRDSTGQCSVQPI